jgi:hypothetical protein
MITIVVALKSFVCVNLFSFSIYSKYSIISLDLALLLVCCHPNPEQWYYLYCCLHYWIWMFDLTSRPPSSYAVDLCTSSIWTLLNQWRVFQYCLQTWLKSQRSRADCYQLRIISHFQKWLPCYFPSQICFQLSTT